MLILYLEYSSSSKEEYITLNKGYEYGINFISLMIIYDLIIYNFWNDCTNFIRKKFHVFWSYMIINIISMILLIITYFVGMFASCISAHFVCYALFILCILAVSVTPSYINFTKLVIIIYLCSNMATFATRYPLLRVLVDVQPVGTVIMSLDIISIIFTSIAVIFFSLDYFWLNNSCYNINDLDKREKKYEANYDGEYQSYHTFNDIQGGRKNDKSNDIIYKN